MLPETIECVIAELDSAIHYENKPTQQQYRNSINIIDFKKIVEFALSLPMDCRIKFGNDGFTFQAALIHSGVTSVINYKRFISVAGRCCQSASSAAAAACPLCTAASNVAG